MNADRRWVISSLHLALAGLRPAAFFLDFPDNAFRAVVAFADFLALRFFTAAAVERRFFPEYQRPSTSRARPREHGGPFARETTSGRP